MGLKNEDGAGDRLSVRLARLGLSLPPVAKPVADYVPALPMGGFGLIQTSGQLPVVDGHLLYAGQVSDQAPKATGFSQTYVDGKGTAQVLKTPLVTPEHAYESARICGLNALSAAAAVAGDVDRLAQVLKVTVFVSSAPGFYGQAQVANGVSELYGQLFAGGHTRSAVGVAVLPLNAPVEVEVQFAVNE